DGWTFDTVSPRSDGGDQVRSVLVDDAGTVWAGILGLGLLLVRGGEVEIDRRILEQMKDPFVHILRNAVDHGIETPEVREQNGKTKCGTVTVSLSEVTNNWVEITISDDGAGIDPAAVKEAAQKRGLLSEKELDGLGDEEALSLIFRSEVSTHSTITDISGRGLGLAIAREKVEDVGGSISVETRLGSGTSFRLVLPLTLATFRGILVEEAEQTFVIPTANVVYAIRVQQDEIQTVEGRETVPYNGRTLPLVPLSEVLKIERKGEKGKAAAIRQALIVGDSGSQIALGVDEVVREQGVLVKGLGPQLARVPNIAGATVLLIIGPAKRLRSAAQSEGSPDPDTRLCPECLSAIPAAARRCAYCTATSSPSTAASSPSASSGAAEQEA
ncbi:MAG: chemotaxis protein CheW, partial [Chloroflexi bacterium]|nr:chemotaxis protein CheW [Chloroflexota bacterium]